MAIISIPTGYFLKKVDLEDKAKLLETLSDMGFPSEEEEGEIWVELTPDRLDMITVEGVIRAVRSYIYGETYEYNLKKAVVTVKKEDVVQRPYITGFTVEGVIDTEFLFEGLIEAQEKIHQTYGRKRKKIAIGVHDWDKIKGDLTYKAVDDVEFVPLDWNEEANVKKILEEHEKGKLYGGLVEQPYPMLFDEEGVISFPPIINSERTKITEKTENFLVDITGINEKAIEDVAKVLATAFIDREGKVAPFSINGKDAFSLKRKSMAINLDEINRVGGVRFNKEELSILLKQSDVLFNGKEVKIPSYRYDINTDADILEEALIAYNYSNLEPVEPKIWEDGELADRWEKERRIMLNMGFIETNSFFLISQEFQKNILKKEPLVVEDAVSREHNSLRQSVALTLLQAENLNKMKTLPQKLFEIGHVYRDGKEFIELGFLIADKEADVDVLISVFKRIVMVKGLGDVKVDEDLHGFNEIFIEGEAFGINIEGYKGVCGVVKPEILDKLNIINVVMIGLLWRVEE